MAMDTSEWSQHDTDVRRRTVGTKFYHYPQSNSGGGFDRPARHVIIEAVDREHADIRAVREVGIYFDGVEKGIDCECCGDRWYSAYDENGTSEPCIYNITLKDALSVLFPGLIMKDNLPPAVIVYYLDHKEVINV